MHKTNTYKDILKPGTTDDLSEALRNLNKLRHENIVLTATLMTLYKRGVIPLGITMIDKIDTYDIYDRCKIEIVESEYNPYNDGCYVVSITEREVLFPSQMFKNAQSVAWSNAAVPGVYNAPKQALP